MLLRVFKIEGHSMMPLINPGDKVLASNIPYWFSSIKKGDIVVFKYDRKLLIKKIAKIENDEFIVEGENDKDSLKVRKLDRKDILGKVIGKL